MTIGNALFGRIAIDNFGKIIITIAIKQANLLATAHTQHFADMGCAIFV